MRTMVMNYARTLDEMIPEATTEVVMSKCDDIHNDIKNAAICALSSFVWAGKAIVDTAELTAIGSKALVKEVFNVDKPDDKATVVIVRR